MYAAVVFLATSSHVILDFITKSGVPILHPWKKKLYGLRIISAHNRAVNKSIMILGILVLAFNLCQAYPVL